KNHPLPLIPLSASQCWTVLTSKNKPPLIALKYNFIITLSVFGGLQLIIKALKIFQESKHPESYACLENLAELYLRKSIQAANIKNISLSQKYKTQTIEYLNQALKVVTMHFPKDSPHIARVQSKLKNLNALS
ncbi:MAG: hypothetical protein JNK42_05860, partial [Caedimonas sp.]|nr:hypothetical protein [Caedimonas sp.]